MEVPRSVFDPANRALGSSALFNANCTGSDCVGDAGISVGSNAIDYESDPTNPIFHRMVLFGGRGWSIYELPDDPDELLKLVFDSGDGAWALIRVTDAIILNMHKFLTNYFLSALAIETTGCKHFPWSHNSEMDEESAPIENFPNNSLWQVADDELRAILIAKNDPAQDGCLDRGDGQPGACSMEDAVDARSAKDGSGVEQIVVGEACGRLVAVTAVEKNSIGLLFDITVLNAPHLVKVFHLSPASQHKSPGIAYNDGTIGDIDPENSVFLSAEQSPTGKTGILFAGAISGTISFWEFDCGDFGSDDNETHSSSATAPKAVPSLVTALSIALGLFGMIA